jgi:hypothetical protein
VDLGYIFLKTYTLFRISLLPLFKFGLFFGLVISLIPGLILTLVARRIIVGFTNWLSGLTYTIDLGIPFTPQLVISVPELLRLQNLLEVLETVVEAGYGLVALTVISLIILGGLFGGAALLLAGLIFNSLSHISGGLMVQGLEKLSDSDEE